MTATRDSAKPEKGRINIVSRQTLLADDPWMRARRVDAATREILANNSVFATTWIVWLLDWYADRPDELRDLLGEWSPETIAHEIREEMQIELSRPVLNKILAGREILTSNSFYRRPWFFIHLCQALWSGDLNPDRFLHIEDPAVLAWGITESLSLNEPDSEDEAWSPEILGYVREVLDRAGLVASPSVIATVMPGAFEPDEMVDWGAFPDQDPEQMEMEYSGQRQETDDIDAEVAERFSAMIGQITRLPLESGQAAGLRGMRTR